MQDRFKFKIAVFEREDNNWIFDRFIENSSNWYITTEGWIGSVLGCSQKYTKETAPKNIYRVYEPVFCTGLKDKNGKLIYEGDIVNEFYLTSTMQPIKRTEQVEYDQERCSFTVGKFFFDLDAVYTILGNIYENKELLND